MNTNSKRQKNLETLRRVSNYLPADEQAALAEVLRDYADMAEQDRQLRVMLARWEQQYGAKDNCVRALKKVLGGGL